MSNPFGRLRASIIVKDEGVGDEYEWYRGLAFTYYGVGHSQPGLVLWDRWKDDGQGGFADYEKLALREFRYHPNPRGRFMARDLDPNDPQEEWSTIGAEHWTDYDRAMPYGDFDVTISAGAPVVAEQMRYLEGFGLPAQQTVSTGTTQYLHGDLIRSTMLTTGQGGTAVSAVSYTAFGELVGTAPDTRYQYAGGWGYESDLLILEGAPGTVPITLMHVGHRWYDPSLGRFIQRDPLGIVGGLNVYAYWLNNPLICFQDRGPDIRFKPVKEAFLRGEEEKGWAIIKAQAAGATAGVAVVGGALAVRAAASAGRCVLPAVSAGQVSLWTRDPGFLRWGRGVISRAGEAFEKGWRIAMGGPKGGWRFHIHIHRKNWWRIWEWLRESEH